MGRMTRCRDTFRVRLSMVDIPGRDRRQGSERNMEVADGKDLIAGSVYPSTYRLHGFGVRCPPREREVRGPLTAFPAESYK